MNSVVFDALRTIKKREGEFVFHDQETRIHMKDSKRVFSTAHTKAKLPERRFQGLRHCAGAYMIMGGAPLATIKGLLGHASTVIPVFSDN